MSLTVAPCCGMEHICHVDDVEQLRGEVERLTRLLGSHADGHRCTCTLVDAGNYNVEGGNAHPPEWEQDPWCPTHPDVDQIKAALGALIEEWRQAADHGEDERYGRIIARTLRGCADELWGVVGGGKSAPPPTSRSRAEDLARLEADVERVKATMGSLIMQWQQAVDRGEVPESRRFALETRLRRLVSDWHADGNRRQFDDPAASAWHAAATSLLEELDRSD